MKTPLYKDELRCSHTCPFLNNDWVWGYCSKFNQTNGREVLSREIQNDGKTLTKRGHIIRSDQCKADGSGNTEAEN